MKTDREIKREIGRATKELRKDQSLQMAMVLQIVRQTLQWVYDESDLAPVDHWENIGKILER